MIDLSTSIGPLSLRNPILLASGTAAQGLELANLVDLGKVGGIVGKSITLNPREGNPPPRVVETSSGMLNTIGLQNPGVDEFEEKYLPEIAKLPTTFIGSIAAYRMEEWPGLTRRFDGMEAVKALELNLSCPNVQTGLHIGTSAKDIFDVISLVKQYTQKPLIAKLTPNVTTILPLAKAAEKAGADAISLVNTFLGMSIDWKTRQSRISAPMGGLSGPAIKPMALRFVYEAVKAVSIPVIGIGGITNAEDILEFLVLGASAIQIGTALFVDPFCLNRLEEELREKLEEAGVESLGQIIKTFGKEAFEDRFIKDES